MSIGALLAEFTGYIPTHVRGWFEQCASAARDTERSNGAEQERARVIAFLRNLPPGLFALGDPPAILAGLTDAIAKRDHHRWPRVHISQPSNHERNCGHESEG